MRRFKHIAKLIREARKRGPHSQATMSFMLGMRAQFISNVERAQCSVPAKYLTKVSELLNVPVENIKVAMVSDFHDYIQEEIDNQKGAPDAAAADHGGHHANAISNAV